MKLKVVSLNMWWGGHLFQEIIDFLKLEDADIVLLQEVYDGRDAKLPENYRSMQVLADRLDYGYNEFAHAYLEKKDEYMIPHGNAVLSKLPIRHSALFHMTNCDREYYLDVPEQWPIFPAPLQHVELESVAGPINVFNMHGVWDLDGDNYSERRQQMSRVMLEAIAEKPNIILAGDSNAKSSNQAMRDLEKDLNSVFGPELKTTFNMRRKDNPGYATAAVDLMYVSANIKIHAKDVPDVDISDHLPLVVTLQID